MAILYTTVGVWFPKIKKRLIAHWIRRIVYDYHKQVGNITCIFCSDDEILRINSYYLSHNYYTDIITFDYSKNNTVSGDLFIAPDVIEYNSKKYGFDYFKELHRVIIHGILHLCEFNDISDNELKIMRENEDKALEKLKL
jgi:rRNA maturation RNase YbeY